MYVISPNYGTHFSYTIFIFFAVFEPFFVYFRESKYEKKFIMLSNYSKPCSSK